MYLSSRAAVVIRPDGQVVTVWGAGDFNPNTLQILGMQLAGQEKKQR
jgi:hypothetical protein